jgi:uncharacterized protein YecE (DUF72 family)
MGVIRTGIGGWVFPPWRGVFYPADLPQKRELEFASRKLTTIEINGTYYGSQNPESFRKWHNETPDDFVFAVKGPRYATNRRVLAESAASINRFLDGGVLELKNKLGPINWQFMATKKFDAEDFAAFLKNLPHKIGAQTIRHAVEVRHESFNTPEFIALARKHNTAIVVAGDSEYPEITERTADFTYARLMGTTETEPVGYSQATIKTWRQRAKNWAKSGDVFLYVISGHKPSNPAAAMALGRE